MKLHDRIDAGYAKLQVCLCLSIASQKDLNRASRVLRKGARGIVRIVSNRLAAVGEEGGLGTGKRGVR